jgi:hypothetical protein
VSAVTGKEKRRGCGSCLACDPPVAAWSRMYVCATCGNKRCPAASNCLAWECSGSNDPNQVTVPVSAVTGDKGNNNE